MKNHRQFITILAVTTAMALPASAMSQPSVLQPAELQKAQADAAAVSQLKMETRAEVKRDVLPSLKDVLIAPSKERRIREGRGLPRPRPYTGIPQPEVVDTVVQTSIKRELTSRAGGPLAPVATVGRNFDGLGNGIPGFTVNSAPPDTHGAVGSTQYVQMHAMKQNE